MDTGKKMAAAMAAVSAYLQQEQEALALQAMDAQAESTAALTVGRPWGMSGRQSQMQLRNLMEMKAFHGWRMR